MLIVKAIGIGLAVLFCAQAADDADKLITVRAKYVSPEGMQHQESASVSQWVGVGREIGVATKEGLSAVVDEANRFGATKVGNFVLVMVAWKIIGKQLLAVILGVPILVAGAGVWVWSLRRFFVGSRFVSKTDGKTKEWQIRPPYHFAGDDARIACGLAHAGFIAGWLLLWIATIFW